MLFLSQHTGVAKTPAPRDSNTSTLSFNSCLACSKCLKSGVSSVLHSHKHANVSCCSLLHTPLLVHHPTKDAQGQQRQITYTCRLQLLTGILDKKNEQKHHTHRIPSIRPATRSSFFSRVPLAWVEPQVPCSSPAIFRRQGYAASAKFLLALVGPG